MWDVESFSEEDEDDDEEMDCRKDRMMPLVGGDGIVRTRPSRNEDGMKWVF